MTLRYLCSYFLSSHFPFSLSVTGNSIRVLIKSKTTQMIVLDSCTEENQWVIIAFCYSRWLIRALASTSAAQLSKVLLKHLLTYLSLCHAQRENFPNFDSLWIVKKNDAYITHTHICTHTCCISGSLCCSPSLEHQCISSLIKAPKWWIIQHSCVSQCHSNWQNIKCLVLLRSVTAHLLISTHS